MKNLLAFDRALIFGFRLVNDHAQELNEFRVEFSGSSWYQEGNPAGTRIIHTNLWQEPAFADHQQKPLDASPEASIWSKLNRDKDFVQHGLIHLVEFSPLE